MIRRFVFFILFAVCFDSEASENSWPGFRNEGNSISEAKNLPLKWSDENGVAWRAELTGFGQSSPVIHSGKAFATSTGGDKKEKLFVEAFDLASGKQVWVKEFAASQTAPEVTEMISRGAPTPAVDEAGVYAFFESGDLIALDLAGEARWQRSFVDDFGEFQGGHGVGSSVVQSSEHLFVLVDHDGPSYLICLDKATGETAWKADREPRVSWTTPLLTEHEGTEQLVVSSNGTVDSYATEDGRRLWRVDGLEGNNVPSPTRAGELLLIGSSAPQQCRAVRLGESVAERTEWKAEGATSSFGSPQAHGGMAFFINRAGALQANSLEDGVRLWETRLPASTWASPVSAGERLYFFCQDGSTVVLSPTAEGPGDPLAENRIAVPEGDRLYGVALVDGLIVMRSAEELIAVGMFPPKSTPSDVTNGKP